MKTRDLTSIKRTIWRITELSVYFMCLTLAIITATDEYNHEERSQGGVALLNQTYKTLYSHNYPGCLMACMDDSQCMSLNYWWYTSQCDLNNRTKYSAESKLFIWDMSSTYMGLMRETETTRTPHRSCRHVHPSNGDGEYSIDPTSSGNPFTVYCDMTTDGGGWVAIQMITFTSSNLRFETSSYKASSYRDLSTYNNARQNFPSTALLQLRNNMGFKQIRFYCHKKNVGTVFHIMTNVNTLGEAVVKYFTDDNPIPSRPQACGSYTVIPDDNSTLSEDCSKLGWNGTHADEKWTDFKSGVHLRLLKALRRIGSQPEDRHAFHSFPMRRYCDDFHAVEASLSAGDTWAVFVR